MFITHRPNVHLLTVELIDIEDLLVDRLRDKGEIDAMGKIRIEPWFRA